MSRIESIIKELSEIAAHPKKSSEALKNSGKKLVGMFPVYTPEEIVLAAGAVPVGLWGGKKSIQKARAYLPPFACSIMQSVMELELEGTYDILSAAVVPSLCDTLKCMGQKWKGKAPVIQFTHPQNRAIEAANVYLAEEYRHVASKLSEALGVDIPEDKLIGAIEVCNENRKALQEFSKAAGEHPELVSPKERHAVIKARYFMERGQHTAKVRELSAELFAAPKKAWKGKKVVLTGIMAEPGELLDIFAEFSLAIAGDDLAQESRQFRTLVPEGSDPYYRLAKQWQDMTGCALAYDEKKPRGQMLIDMVKDLGADAVIVCMMKFCDPEEYDYAVYNTQFDKAGVRHLTLEIDQETTSFEQARTRIQSFSEIL